MSTYNTIRALPELDARGLNVKLVAVPSPQLFAVQPAEYRQRVITEADKWDSTFITNRSRRLFYDWIFNPLATEYAISSIGMTAGAPAARSMRSVPKRTSIRKASLPASSGS